MNYTVMCTCFAIWCYMCIIKSISFVIKQLVCLSIYLSGEHCFWQATWNRKLHWLCVFPGGRPLRRFRPSQGGQAADRATQDSVHRLWLYQPRYVQQSQKLCRSGSEGEWGNLLVSQSLSLSLSLVVCFDHLACIDCVTKWNWNHHFVVVCINNVWLFHLVSLGNSGNLECWKEQHGIWIQQRDLEPDKELCRGKSWELHDKSPYYVKFIPSELLYLWWLQLGLVIKHPGYSVPQ